MTKHMTATEARQNFFALLKTAQKPGMTVMVTHEGHPAVVVMSYEEFEGWQETFDIMRDPVLTKDLEKALKKKEKGIPWEKVEKELRR